MLSAKHLFRRIVILQNEWCAIGVQQSMGWVQYSTISSRRRRMSPPLWRLTRCSRVTSPGRGRNSCSYAISTIIYLYVAAATSGGGGGKQQWWWWRSMTMVVAGDGDGGGERQRWWRRRRAKVCGPTVEGRRTGGGGNGGWWRPGVAMGFEITK